MLYKAVVGFHLFYYRFTRALTCALMRTRHFCTCTEASRWVDEASHHHHYRFTQPGLNREQPIFDARYTYSISLSKGGIGYMSCIFVCFYLEMSCKKAKNERQRISWGFLQQYKFHKEIYVRRHKFIKKNSMQQSESPNSTDTQAAVEVCLEQIQA